MQGVPKEMNEHVFMKVLIKAPCVKERYGEKSAPSVDCDWNCDACAWNPREHLRRMREGTFENGQLHFKRRFK